MANPEQQSNSPSPEAAAVVSSPGLTIHTEHSVEGPCEVRAVDARIHETLRKQIHALLNSLWPATSRLELEITDKNCPPKLLESFSKIKQSVDEATVIAWQMSKQIDTLSSSRHENSQ